MTQTFTILAGGRVLQITVADVTCRFPGCPNERRAPRAGYCVEHDVPGVRQAASRARHRLADRIEP